MKHHVFYPRKLSLQAKLWKWSSLAPKSDRNPILKLFNHVDYRLRLATPRKKYINKKKNEQLKS